MQTLTIDLKKNPDIADLVKLMQPADLIDLHTSIKALDDQTLTLTVESASEGKEEDEDDEQDAPEGDNEGSSAAPGDDLTKPGASMDGPSGSDAMGLLSSDNAALG